MKYKDIIDNADKFEEEYELIECMYFEALEKLKEVQEDLKKLDDVKHVRRVIKLFLIHWGSMARVVSRKGLKWIELAETLRNLEKEFGELRKRKMLTVDFNDNTVASSIKTIYKKIRSYKYLGSPTTTSKILHLLNPEIFVMWDKAIFVSYHRRNNHIDYSPEGYLEFLKEMQKEITEAVYGYKTETGKELNEIERELRERYSNKTLAKIIDESNWIRKNK